MVSDQLAGQLDGDVDPTVQVLPAHLSQVENVADQHMQNESTLFRLKVRQGGLDLDVDRLGDGVVSDNEGLHNRLLS